MRDIRTRALVWVGEKARRRLMIEASDWRLTVPRVLVASDGSDVAIAAARRGVSLLPPDSEVTVIAVAPLISPVTGLPRGGIETGPVVDPGTIDEIEAARRATARHHIDATVDALGIDAVGLLEHGDPADRICDVARTGQFDLVVIGSHGSGFVKRALLGSVSQDVLHHAPCPVLVVRHVEAEDAT